MGVIRVYVDGKKHKNKIVDTKEEAKELKKQWEKEGLKVKYSKFLGADDCEHYEVEGEV